MPVMLHAVRNPHSKRPARSAIVGAGFSGTALAIRLLHTAAERPLRIVIVERSGCLGPGLAYTISSRRIGCTQPSRNQPKSPPAVARGRSIPPTSTRAAATLRQRTCRAAMYRHI
jgi:2-polyprenyl-6-methoxyphenol hydroxylase-like FAD-dependent oxidoreductase